MRKFLAVLIGLAIGFQLAPAQAANAPSSFLVLSEVDCNNEWVELVNRHSSLSLNTKNFVVNVIETDGGALQNTFTLPKAVIKPGKAVLISQTDLGFGIGCGEESLVLKDSSSKEIDRVSIPNLADGVTWSRFGAMWKGGIPTSGAKNQALASDVYDDQAGWIFDSSQSFRINLTIDPQYLDPNNPVGLIQKPKEYVPATFRFKDASGTLLPAEGALEVGVRSKGSVGSTNGGQINLANGKIGLKLKFNWSVPGQDFLGLKRLTLNNMIQDSSMIHETLAYKLFSELGLIAPRTGFVQLFLRQGNADFEYKGLYLNLESYDEIMMARHRTSMQHMFDATWAPGYNRFTKTCTSNPWHAPEITVEHFRCNFEVDRGDPEKLADLEALADALDNRESLSKAAKKIIDVKQVATFFAAEKYINHWDGQSGSPSWTPNNYRMFSDKDGNFEFLPWGTDGTWFAFDEPVPDWLLQGGVTSGAEPFGTAQSKLFAQCLADDQCNSEYLKALARISNLADYADFANELFTTHQDARQADTNRFSDEGTAQWALSETLAFIQDRPTQALDYIEEHATGAIRWQPANTKLAAGSKLTSSLLNAYSDVLGTFKYSKKLGSVLKAGNYSIKVTFTPLESENWDVKTKTIKFTVK
ncbi:MAG: hypothetical protein RLZZ330_710 [Actinomycetota bacterium]|jgi:spore coat protein CotH